MPVMLPYYSFQAIDWQFAQMLTRLVQAGKEEELKRLLAYVSQETRNGHVCIHISRLPKEVMGETFSFKNLNTYGLIGAPGEKTPLILDGERLYLERYWQYEQTLATLLYERAGSAKLPASIDEIKKYSKERFGTAEKMDSQAICVLMAVFQKLVLITGGPGTGKTRTIAEILNLFHELAPSLRVAVCAPTGKASQRLTEALRAYSLPYEAVTIDRLLGYVPYQTTFRHTAENPLAIDVLIVDEASMIALGLMVKLISACLPQTRLVLVGDPNQLASVETGNVLGDMVKATGEDFSKLSFSDLMKDRFQEIWPDLELGTETSLTAQMYPLMDAHIHLTKEYRFEEGGFLSSAAKHVQHGNVDEFWKIIEDPQNKSVLFQEVEDPTDIIKIVTEKAKTLFLERKEIVSTSEILEKIKEMAILCAIRKGKIGVEQINAMIERRILNALNISPQTIFYDGKPLLITENSYEKQLFNGDMGIVKKSSESVLQWNAKFLTSEEVKTISVLQLPAYETAYAITIHKSQGSEFNTVWVILPFEKMPIWGRELIYTALTRAKKNVVFLGKKEILSFAISNSIYRESGLYDALVARAIAKKES